MADRIEIEIITHDASSGIIKGIASQLGSLGGVASDVANVFSSSAYAQNLYKRALTDSSISIDQVRQAEEATSIATARLAEQVAILIIRFGKESVDATVKYAQEVKNLSLISGESMENTSRFVQVLDDYELSVEDALTATRTLTKNGLAPNLETLARLSDKYNSLNSVQEKNKFILDNLGRSGTKWAKVLELGGDKVRELGENVDDALIATDALYQKTEQYRLLQDQLNDTWQATKIQVGTQLIPVLNDLMKAITNNIEEGVTLGSVFDKISGISTLGLAPALRDVWKAHKENSAALQESTEKQNVHRLETEYDIPTEKELNDILKEQEKAIKALQEANADRLQDAIAIQEANDNFQQSQSDILIQIDELKAKKEELYPWEVDKIKEVQEKIDELSQKYNENGEEFVKASQQKIAMMAVEKIAMLDGVAGFSEAEFLKAQAILATSDIATAAAFNEQQAMEILSGAVATGAIDVQEFGNILDKVMADGVTSVDEVTNAINNIPSHRTVKIDIQLNNASSLVNAGVPSTVANQIAGGRAGGGNTIAGMLYKVNETRTEYFQPSQNGTVIPIGGNGNNSNASITLQINSPVTVMDKSTTVDTLKEYLRLAYKQLQSEGAI